MRRIVFDQYGEPGEALRLEERETPEPGPGEVRLSMRLAPIHPADLAFTRGQYVPAESFPAPCGIEGLGIVEAAGPDVTTLAPDTRCVVAGRHGTWADSMIVPADALFPVPDGVADETACQLYINPMTAAGLLDKIARPGAVVQTAAGSAVGRLVMQLGRAQGRKIINIVRHPETARDLESRGADAVVLSGDPDWADTVAAAAGADQVAAALDPVSGETAEALLHVLSPGGELILYGALSGQPVTVSAMSLAAKDLAVRAFWLGQMQGQDPAEQARKFQNLAGMLGRGDLEIPVAETFNLADFKDAVAAAESPGRLGKTLLRLSTG